MPTLPPSVPPPAHLARDMAESFGADAERYDRTRPRYPGALIERIVATAPGPMVLDVGCGTGIVARQLGAAGCQVLGVEPDPRMAAFARQSGVETEMAKFEEWEPAGRQFDAVVAGQTWHWVEPVAGAARAAEVLRPGGLLSVFWNVFQPPPELAEAFAAVYRRVLPDMPIFQNAAAPGQDGYGGFYGAAADGMLRAGAFGEPERWQYDWERTYTRDEWLDVVPTSGLHSRFPAETLRELLGGIGEAVDAVGGAFPMHYTTGAVSARRR